MTVYVQRQLHVVAINARGQASAEPVTLGDAGEDASSSKKRSEPEPETEEIQVGNMVMTVPAALASLSGAELRAVLWAGWQKLPHVERAALSELLPKGVKAEQLLSMAGVAAHLSDPVDNFARRLQLGLLHPPVVAHRVRLMELEKRVAEIEAAASSAVAAAEKAAQEEGRIILDGDKMGQLQWREADDLSSGESELAAVVRAGAKPRQSKRREPVARKRHAEMTIQQQQQQQQQQQPMASVTTGGDVALNSGGGIVLDAQQQASMTRAQKKTQSRIVNGVFLSAFNMLIKVREVLLKYKQMTLSELVSALAQDPAVANDGVEGLTAVQLARVAVGFLQRSTRCHKTDFGPYVAPVPTDASRVQWIDDSDYDEFEVLLELESAERLLRYGLSRGVVDMMSGTVSHSSIKELKNNPVTVRRMPPEQLREFHRQEWARYENASQPFCYRLAGLQPFCVAPQRGKTLVKIARRHAMLVDERPSTVTLQDVVRDAVARLPQGVGTKSDLQVVVMDSQFVNQDVTAAVLSSAISDSLDRLSAVSDPAASFHATSRLWSYLHRNRGMHEFASGGEDE